MPATIPAPTAEAPRFAAGRHFGVLTVRDRETDLVIVHQAAWTEDMAKFVASRLESAPRRVALFDWEMLG